MAAYKFNQFHWHLTEDQGWRIAIKKYPKVTTIGSRRPETMLEKNFNPCKDDGVPVEDFYTQDEIREVVAYAKARKINVISEIELPGHSSAALQGKFHLVETNCDWTTEDKTGLFTQFQQRTAAIRSLSRTLQSLPTAVVDSSSVYHRKSSYF